MTQSDVVRKVLSANDVGATGGHQAGMLIPKNAGILAMFPRLDPRATNPRARVDVFERLSGQEWSFMFIYYNNRKRGGTRDEYRLTGMTEYLRSVAARAGDSLEFGRAPEQGLLVRLLRVDEVDSDSEAGERISLSGSWVVIRR